MRIKTLVTPCIFIIALCGCATKWYKPGATEADFYNDKISCINIANNMWPVNMMPMSAGYTTPVRTNCYRTGNYVNCQQSGGQYVAPAVIDTNIVARDVEVRQCLRARGYTQQ